MKTSKQVSSDLASSRRAQPLRQTRNNPPRSSISGTRPFGSRASITGGIEENQSIDIFPAITHFADAITALPKELVRHFTLLKEVDAKIFAPEEELGKLIDAVLNSPPKRPQAVETHHALGPTSTPMSAQGSLNGSVINGHAGSANSVLETGDVYDQSNVPRRQLYQHAAYTMSNMLVSLDEKNHVISTAAEALSKQLARIDDCFPYIELEISEEARYGSTTHWAYPENRVPKTGAVSRREIAAANNLSAAAQHLVDEAAARSDARKQALAAKKGKNQHADSDFDDQDSRQKDKKLHGNSKVRKAADTGVGLGITNGATTNGNPPKRQKVANKVPAGGAGMERSLSSVFGSNGTATKGKTGSPRETPVPEAKKRSRAAAGTGQTRKRYVAISLVRSRIAHTNSRNNTVNSTAMSPSLASSPIRSTFPETRPAPTGTPPPTNGRPTSIRARQNSTQSVIEKRAPSEVASKQNGHTAGTPDLGTAAIITGRSVPEVKASMKETGSNSKSDHLLEDSNQDNPDMVGGLLVGSRKGSTTTKQEEPESNGDSMQDIQTTTITTTKSGRASKPSTPAIPQFPETVRSRSSRALETSSVNKRSHKKGAGAAAQQLLAQQVQPDGGDDGASNMDEEEVDEDINADEPTYCYCNGVSYGEMVGCDARDCEREWFHLECVGLKVAPKGSAKWYCDDCMKKRPNQKRR
ncbi:related to p33ING1b (ING1) protein [Phialocephala subalpina]|uniref:Chromatin modification-related protein n=1 Tax=Phialocephala subalpina TaxID=576137 RepID=A0A1L7WZ22_9HELO|nr:related to p33ING1b (ING1) protein [Phialocephala subalpina]